ncbi:hypothetical protein [Parasphingorhabdus cellanae]|uniref:Uncharacterized protein n=1 Tax=Parasphingorhabdus cellanae TaxID=2806553 RepID=A0ABX7T886_9SPHN|nr:hypothetical protein [Parasphingorhabdus cellanae]QTD56158.1 hypothetical protein J4G78_00685 [Parasphingorhabdus cellanae]
MPKPLLLAFFPLVATTSFIQAAPLDPECIDHVENIDSGKIPEPTMRALGDEPPAAQIAAVDRRVNNCSVLVLINPQLAGEPRWTPPLEAPTVKQYQTFGD